MGIIWKRGDLTQSTCQTLGVTVNTVGVMGKGIALTFAQKWPALEQAYKAACRQGHFKHSTLFAHTPGGSEQRALCVVTKQHWRNPSEMIWIEAALQEIVHTFEDLGITSLALPALGCGNGQLVWSEVRALMHYWLGYLPIPIEIYAP